MDWWTAIAVGFLGSFHCIGMCGPIALALPYHSHRWQSTLATGSAYNGGRIIGYGFIGLLFGLIGQSLSMVGIQKLLSIAIGILFLVSAFWQLTSRKRLHLPAFIQQYVQSIQSKLSKLLTLARQDQLGDKQMLLGKKFILLGGIGFMNAFIPCGLVYLAVAGAITQAHYLSGTMYMILFGLGTLPLMIILSLSHHLFHPRFRYFIRKMSPFVMMFFAGLFILRGLNIDLPSNLTFWIDQGSPPMCH